MASPFSLFRKNQKAMLATLTLLAMFAFVFLDPIMRYVAPNAAMADPVIVETNFGNLKRSDVAKLQAQRGMVESFLTTLAFTTVDKLQDQGLMDLRSPGMLEFAGRQRAEYFLQRVMRSPNPTDERETIYTQLLARRAEGLHMVVSDAAINSLLQELTMNAVDGRSMAEIISRLKQNGSSVSEQQLFNALRTEMLAEAAARSFAVSLEGTPPAELWDYYRRLHQQATIEAVAVPVAHFQDEVKDPGDEVLKKFYDEHKTKIAIPGSPEPGFKLPPRAQFQFFKAEYDLFRESATVTDEEIAKYYEDNKATMFQKLELPKEDEDADADEAATDEKTEPAADAEILDDTDDGAEDKPANGDSAESDEAGTDESTTDEPANPEPTEQPSEEPASEGNPGTDELTAGADSTIEVALEDGPALTAPATDEAAAETPDAEKPADETATTDEDDAAEAPTDSTDDATDEATGDNATDDEKVAETPEPEYEPLDKVRDQIERTLKMQKAEEKIRGVVEKLTSRLGAYSHNRTQYMVNKSRNPNLTEPKLPNFAELAKEEQVSFQETPLVSFFELSEDKSLGAARYGQLPFPRHAFMSMNALYEPITAEDVEGNVYLVWKIAQEEEEVPKFEDIRDTVLAKYQQVEARGLARKRAEELAAEARSSKEPLAKSTADSGFKLVSPPPFSWMTLGTTAENANGLVPMISEVADIESPGDAFMRATFGLDPGDIGVAFNQPEDICYAIQLLEYDPPAGELEESFAREDFRRYLNVAVGEKQQLLRSWLTQVEKDAGVKWLQAPSQQQ
jgi:hypothetical protein